jgi:hypothetical protein
MSAAEAQSPTASPEAFPAAEPTLGQLMTHYARTAVPSRLYKLLQFGIPFALDFGLHGYWRAAMGGVAVAALGAWGLADRWLYDAGERYDGRTKLTRYGRAASAAVAASLALLLFIALFLRLLGRSPIS